MDTKRRNRTSLALLLLILGLAGGLRWAGLNWDGGIGAHPDERYVVGVAEDMYHSGEMNPFAVASDYAYGHLPLYVLMGTMACFPSQDPLLIGRALAALFDLGTVGMVFLLGKRLCGEGVALWAALGIAVTVLHIQQAHFYTADVPGALGVVVTLWFAVRWAEGGRWRDAVLTGGCAGLAVGTKADAILLGLPIVAAGLLTPVRSRGARWGMAGLAGLAALLTFGVTNPYALISFGTVWRNLARQAAIVRGALDVPYIRQFHARWPYLDQAVQLCRWGMGWPLGMAALGGLGYGVWRAIRHPPRAGEWVLLTWLLPGLAFVGGLYAKFPRYVLPFTPLLVLYAARGLYALKRRWRWVGAVVCGVVLISALARSIALMGLYRSPHPWQVASAWFDAHVPPGAVIAVEEWDQPLPVGAAERGYTLRTLPVFDEESRAKWERIEGILSSADYVVIASRRGYGTLARWPDRYPRTAAYYRALFGGELGWRPVACFSREAHLGPLVWRDDPTTGLGFSLPPVCETPGREWVWRLGLLDESLVVYDHPRVIIFARCDALSYYEAS